MAFVLKALKNQTASADPLLDLETLDIGAPMKLAANLLLTALLASCSDGAEKGGHKRPGESTGDNSTLSTNANASPSAAPTPTATPNGDQGSSGSNGKFLSGNLKSKAGGSFDAKILVMGDSADIRLERQASTLQSSSSASNQLKYEFKGKVVIRDKGCTETTALTVNDGKTTFDLAVKFKTSRTDIACPAVEIVDNAEGSLRADRSKKEDLKGNLTRTDCRFQTIDACSSGK